MSNVVYKLLWGSTCTALVKYDQSIQAFVKVSVRSLVENQYHGKSLNKFADRFLFALMYGDLRIGWQTE